MQVVSSLLKEFQPKTGSKEAARILSDWPAEASHFVKVFPHEYQRVLKAKLQAIPEPAKETPKPEPQVKDIEDAVPDKLRGFMKYSREKGMYRPASERMNDWEEIYNFPNVRKGS